MSLKIEVNTDSLISELKKISKEIRNNIENGIDVQLDQDVETLKSSLFQIVNSEIKVDNKTANSDPNQPKTLDLPKSKNELIKQLFGSDIMGSDFVTKSLKANVMNDNSNVFVIKNNRIKAWQSISDSTSYSASESLFRDRLKNGIIVDADTGKIYKVSPEAVKGIKVECSTDTGETVKSDKKFDAYKQSTKITRRKNDSPYQRVAVWTVKQDDLKFMMNNSISVDQLIEYVQAGNYDLALGVLSKNNGNGSLKQVIDNLNNLKSGKMLSPQTQAYQNVQELIRNLKIRKRISKYKTSYTLFSSYNRDVEDTEVKFFDALRKEVYLWMIENQEVWYNTMVKAVEKVLQSYGNIK